MCEALCVDEVKGPPYVLTSTKQNRTEEYLSCYTCPGRHVLKAGRCLQEVRGIVQLTSVVGYVIQCDARCISLEGSRVTCREASRSSLRT
jgi:hypothetical protein